MGLISKIATCIGGAIVCFALSSSAQERSAWTELDFMQQSEAWLSANNATGLKYTPVDTISEINFNGDFNKGSFINYNQSNQSYSIGGQAQSYFRLNNRVVLFGHISYASFTGKNMGASAWIDPEFAPFNLIEYADTTRGEKTMETYHLTGATAIDLSQKLTIGGKINYIAANYVKKKDLRHLNMLMDFELSLGAMYQITDFAQLGLNYDYRKRVEETNFDSFGNTDRTYNTLISWGTFWGQVEGFGAEGFTGQNDNNPLVDKSNQFSLQLNLDINHRLRVFNEISVSQSEGYFGIQSDQTKVYSEHSANVMTYKGSLSFSQEKTLHLFHLQASNNKLTNWKTNYYFDHNPESGITLVKYNAPTKVLSRTHRLVSAGYQLHIGHKDLHPQWSFEANIDYRTRIQKVSVYPFYRNQTINQLIGKLHVKRNLIFGKNQYTFQLGGLYSTGNGTPLDAGTYAGSTEKPSAYRSTDFNLNREFEYLTATRLTTQAEFKYSRLLNENKIKAFAGLSYEQTKASDIEFIKGNTFQSASLTIGCSF